MKERMFRWLEWRTVVVMEMFLLLAIIPRETLASRSPLQIKPQGQVERTWLASGLGQSGEHESVTDAVAAGREAENQTASGHKPRPWASV